MLFHEMTGFCGKFNGFVLALGPLALKDHKRRKDELLLLEQGAQRLGQAERHV